MQTRLGLSSARTLTTALLLSGATLLMAFGCGGSDSKGGGNTPGAGTSAGGDAGDTSSGGSGEAGKASGGKAGAGKGGAGNTNHGSAGEAGETNNGEGGEGGAIDLPPAKNTSAVSFMASGAVSKSKNFLLISGTGESLGGTVGSKRSKSLKYTYIPGVIAASSN